MYTAKPAGLLDNAAPKTHKHGIDYGKIIEGHEGHHYQQQPTNRIGLRRL